jgi:hypothetical protein
LDVVDDDGDDDDDDEEDDEVEVVDDDEEEGFVEVDEVEVTVVEDLESDLSMFSSMMVPNGANSSSTSVLPKVEGIFAT